MPELFGTPTGMPNAQFMPESTHELDFQLFKIDKTIFANPKIAKLLTDDAVRSYLNERWILALYYYASAYVGLVNASQGEYEGAFDNAAEIVLADIMFLVNIARSRQGANVATIKGRPIHRELFPEDNPKQGLMSKIPNPIPQRQDNPPMTEQYYTQDLRGIR